jgi:NAD+ synthase (glutamine-hydrolysing)
MDFGWIRAAAGFPSVKVGDVSYNASQIIGCIQEASKQEVQVLVLPELCVCGYTCGDLFYQDVLIQGSMEALGTIVKATRNTRVLVFLGMPILFRGCLYNCAVGIQSGKILGVVPKTHLPNHNEFYEKRWFTSGQNLKGQSITLFGEMVPFGADLLFEEGNFQEVVLGVEICEDMWVPVSPGSLMSQAGAVLILNLSASNELVGKGDYRKQLLINESARCISAYLYASSGPGESTTDMVFGGYGLICEYGTVMAEKECFENQTQLIFSDIDIQKLMAARKKNTAFATPMVWDYRRLPFEGKLSIPQTLYRYIDPHPFVPTDPLERDKRCREIFRIQIQGLSQRLRAIGTNKAILGISGGLDSTLALLVSVGALDLLGISRQNIYAVTMPGFGTTEKTYQNALELIQSLGVHWVNIDIKEACLLHFKDIGQDPNRHDVTYENVQARERTQVLMDLANRVSGIVIGTGDLSELALGFCTYNGDHMSMYGVNAGVPKTLVRFLVEWVASDFKDAKIQSVLEKILKTPISPELIPPNENGEMAQKTEDILGAYELHDFFIYHMLRWGSGPSKIFYLAKKAFEGKYADAEIKKILDLFLNRFFSQQFKRSCLPDGPKVGTVSLSPRGDLKMPSDASAKLWLTDLQENLLP